MWCNVMWMGDDSCIKCQSLNAEGTCGRCRCKKAWSKVVKTDLKTVNLLEETTRDPDE